MNKLLILILALGMAGCNVPSEPATKQDVYQGIAQILLKQSEIFIYIAKNTDDPWAREYAFHAARLNAKFAYDLTKDQP